MVLQNAAEKSGSLQILAQSRVPTTVLAAGNLPIPIDFAPNSSLTSTIPQADAHGSPQRQLIAGAKYKLALASPARAAYAQTPSPPAGSGKPLKE